jgi:hypothetical protein
MFQEETFSFEPLKVVRRNGLLERKSKEHTPKIEDFY